MANNLDILGSIFIPAVVSFLTLIISYLWQRRINNPKMRGLNWVFVRSNESHSYSKGWICLLVENQKGKLFKWFFDKKEIAENVKGFIKLFKDEKLIASQNLGWGLTHGNPKEISLNVGEVQRLDVLMKIEDGWCITSGRETLRDPIVYSLPIQNQRLRVEIIISGKNFSPITSIYKITFPEDLIKFAQDNSPFIQN